MTFRTRPVRLPAMALLVLLCTTLGASAQDAANLKGLTAVAVHVNPIVSPVGTIDVSMTRLEADIQQRLRQAGITIVAGQAPRPFGTQGNLWANVTIMRSPDSSQWFLQTSLKLYGSVVLAGSSRESKVPVALFVRQHLRQTPGDEYR